MWAGAAARAAAGLGSRVEAEAMELERMGVNICWSTLSMVLTEALCYHCNTVLVLPCIRHEIALY